MRKYGRIVAKEHSWVLGRCSAADVADRKHLVQSEAGGLSGGQSYVADRVTLSAADGNTAWGLRLVDVPPDFIRTNRALEPKKTSLQGHFYKPNSLFVR